MRYPHLSVHPHPNNKTTVYRKTALTYRLYENPNKQTIVMLHPAFADQTLFEPQINYFRGPYQIITLDLPGHGDNPLHGTGVTLKDIPEIIHQILIELNIAACHLVGVSLGSLAAQACAARYPKLIQSVTVVGGYSIHKDNKEILRAQQKEGLKWILYVLFSMERFRTYTASISCYTPHGKSVFHQGVKRFGRRSFASMSGMNTLFTPRTEPVPYPLLLVTGEHDLPLARQAAQQFHQHEPHSNWIQIPKAGHCANIDQPEIFNKKLEQFLNSII